MARMRSHFADRSAAFATSGKALASLSMIDSGAPFILRASSVQTSSLVKARIGAISRSMVCVISHKAVCAERRAFELGAVV